MFSVPPLPCLCRWKGWLNGLCTGWGIRLLSGLSFCQYAHGFSGYLVGVSVAGFPRRSQTVWLRVPLSTPDLNYRIYLKSSFANKTCNTGDGNHYVQQMAVPKVYLTALHFFFFTLIDKLTDYVILKLHTWTPMQHYLHFPLLGSENCDFIIWRKTCFWVKPFISIKNAFDLV